MIEYLIWGLAVIGGFIVLIFLLGFFNAFLNNFKREPVSTLYIKQDELPFKVQVGKNGTWIQGKTAEDALFAAMAMRYPELAVWKSLEVK